jgi:soluble lytic murein transglycosylase-like protein
MRFQDVVEQAGRRYRVSPFLIHAVIQAESGYNPDAVSRKGAVGLMQLTPATALRYGVTDAHDPEQNIRGGTQYLRELLGMFNQDLGLALAAYNAGEGAVLRHGGIPPYPETAQYVLKVLESYGVQQRGGTSMPGRAFR